MINPIAVQVGPISLYWYAIFILTGLLLAVFLAQKEAPRRGLRSDDIVDMILYAFPLGIVGARIYYVAFEWSYYREHLSEIIAIRQGGLAIYGGLIAGGLVLFQFCYRRVINPLDMLDVAAPGVLVAQSIGRWGNFVNQEAYGKAVKTLDYLPQWIREQMFIDGSYRVPTFLYESLWNLIGFGIILVLRRRKAFLKQGEVFAFYLMWYGCGRFVIEGMRTDSLMLGGLRVSQWLSVFLLLFAIGFVTYRRRLVAVPYYQEK